jgi:hypothetical protein
MWCLVNIVVGLMWGPDNPGKERMSCQPSLILILCRADTPASEFAGGLCNRCALTRLQRLKEMKKIVRPLFITPGA